MGVLTHVHIIRLSKLESTDLFENYVLRVIVKHIADFTGKFAVCRSRVLLNSFV